MFLSECLQRTHVATSTSVADVVIFLLEGKLWKRGQVEVFRIFLSSSSPTVGWLLHSGCQHSTHTHQVSEKLSMFELCKKYEYCDKVQIMWKSPDLYECSTVWMEFLWECMKEGDELGNEWVWRVFSLTTIIIAMQQIFKVEYFLYIILLFLLFLSFNGVWKMNATLNVNKLLNIWEFEWSFYPEVKMLEKVWKWGIFLKIPSSARMRRNGKYLWNDE